jgi:hypothetical protein
MEPWRYRMRLVFSSALIAIISVPLILQLVPPNNIYGFRTSLTRSTPELWYAANAFMGWALLIASAISMALVLNLPETEQRWRMRVAFLTPILSAVAISFAYLMRLD